MSSCDYKDSQKGVENRIMGSCKQLKSRKQRFLHKTGLKRKKKLMPPICPKGNQSRGLDVLARYQCFSLGWQRQWPDSSPFLNQTESSSEIPLEGGWRYTHPYSSSVRARNLVLVFSHYPLPRHWGITQEQNVTFT